MLTEVTEKMQSMPIVISKRSSETNLHIFVNVHDAMVANILIRLLHQMVVILILLNLIYLMSQLNVVV